MTSRLLVATLHTMLYTGIILTPTIRAHALSDLGDLRFVINTAASRIGAPTNSSRNWGIGVWPPSTGDNIVWRYPITSCESLGPLTVIFLRVPQILWPISHPRFLRQITV
jgi:hypothetical protein